MKESHAFFINSSLLIIAANTARNEWIGALAALWALIYAINGLVASFSEKK